MTVFADSSRFIMDLGMHSGDDTAYYLAKDFEVVALEPNPVLAAAARARFAADIAAKRLTLVEAAIWSEAGAGSFHLSESGDLRGSLLPAQLVAEGTPGRGIELPTVTLGDLFDRFGTPLYIKIDVEGGDRMAIDQLVRQLVKPLYVSVEEHGAGFELVATLSACGYNGFQLVDRSEVPAMSDPDLPFTFTEGSAGPFGDALPGDWLARGAFEAEYAARILTREGARIAPPGRVFDIHATRL